MANTLSYKRFGERAILIEWPAVIDEHILQEIIQFKEAIASDIRIQDLLICYNSLTLIYSDFIEDYEKEVEHLKSLEVNETNKTDIEQTTWTIPVCYEDMFGIDLKKISIGLKLSKAEIIELHTIPTYTVFFIGFLPGFMYLGGLNDKLHYPRKENPRLKVEKGSVGIGGAQTGIYPSESAGGWNIIGKTPIPLFNAERRHPCFVKPGDKVKFKAISFEEFKAIENDYSLQSKCFQND